MAVIETRKRSDGTVSYRARVRMQGREFTQTFARKTDARTWSTQIEAELKLGTALPDREAGRLTLAKLIDRYVAQTLPFKHRNADRKKTAAILAWWKAEIGNLPVQSVSAAVIAERKGRLRAEKTKRGEQRSPATVNRYLAALSGVFKEAVREYHVLNTNPVSAVSRGSESSGIVRWLDEAERKALLDACRQSPAEFLYPLVVLALQTGGRRGELLGLTWRNVDLGRGVIVFDKTKNGDRRAVPIESEALDLLKARSKVRRIGSDLVFHGERENRPPDIEKPWRAALKASGVENFRFHDLRHTTASYLAMSGATPQEIAAVLGHRTLQMVKRYSHLGDQHTAAVVQKMTTKFFPAA